MDYISHIRQDDNLYTCCGNPWQGWQVPIGITIMEPQPTIDPPTNPPKKHIDKVKLCGACYRICIL